MKAIIYQMISQTPPHREMLHALSELENRDRELCTWMSSHVETVWKNSRVFRKK